MTINVLRENGVVTIIPEGNIDYTNAAELDEVVVKEVDAANKMIIDLSKIDFVASAGLRVLLNADDLMSSKDGLEITNANAYVKEVFKMTGFSAQLNIK